MKMKFNPRSSTTLLILYVTGAMLAAANVGLPADYFWGRFVVSVLIAGIFAWRGYLEDPTMDKTKGKVELIQEKNKN